MSCDFSKESAGWIAAQARNDMTFFNSKIPLPFTSFIGNDTKKKSLSEYQPVGAA